MSQSIHIVDWLISNQRNLSSDDISFFLPPTSAQWSADVFEMNLSDDSELLFLSNVDVEPSAPPH